MTSRENSLDPNHDIRGTDVQVSSLDISEESLSLGPPISGQSGVAATIIVSMGVVTVTGVSGMTVDDSLGRFITLSGAATLDNVGTFQIISVISGSTIRISNNLAVTDANNGFISWIEREPYTLEADINYARSDRENIKGVGYDDPVPTYIRPDATTTDVSANLANIASKTTDATTIVTNDKVEDVLVDVGDGYVSVSGSFNYADNIDTLGYPISDGYDAGNDAATFVYIVSDGYATPLAVLSGPNAGDRIFGVARQGTSGVDGYSIEVEFRSAPQGDPVTSSSAYSWEAGLIDTVDMYFGLRERLDLVADTYLRTEWVNGLFGVSFTSGGGGGGGGGAPSGPAGGDLSGTYPNPNVVDFTISSEEQGSVLYFNGATWVQLAPGVDGYILATGGTGANPEWVAPPAGTGAINSTDHAALRQLIHLADGVGGPFEEFVSGAFREILPSANPFPTSIIWYEDVTKTQKIVEKTIVRNANQTPATVMWEAYDEDGSTIVATVTDTMSYTGVFEISRTRAIA